MNLQETHDDFVLYLSAEKGLSKNTLEAYSHDVLLLNAFLKEMLSITCYKTVTLDILVDFLAHLHAKKYASSSIARFLMAIKVLFRYLKREKYIDTNITLYLDTPKLWQLLPEVLSPNEVENLLAQPDSNTAAGSCDRAIFELLYASGLRVSELCGLNIYDVDDEHVRVFGKGRKERIVPLGKKALEAIDHYLLHYRCLSDSEEETALFLNSRGKRISREKVWERIKFYAKKAGIEKKISPHTLRHSFATHLLDNGADIRVIQEMMGHANVASTDRYMHLSCNQVQDAFNRFHPHS